MPAYVPPTWEWEGEQYDTLEEAVAAAGETHNIHSKYSTWVSGVIQSFINRDVAQVYNRLGDKMYEHKNMQAEINETITATFGRLQDRIDTLENENKVLWNDIGIALSNNLAITEGLREAKKNNDTLLQNQNTLLQGVRQLSQQITELKSQQGSSTQQFLNQFAPPGANVSQHTEESTGKAQRPKIPEPPKYEGTKDKDSTLEEWLKKLGVWFRYNKISQDEDR